MVWMTSMMFVQKERTYIIHFEHYIHLVPKYDRQLMLQVGEKYDGVHYLKIVLQLGTRNLQSLVGDSQLGTRSWGLAISNRLILNLSGSCWLVMSHPDS